MCRRKGHWCRGYCVRIFGIAWYRDKSDRRSAQDSIPQRGVVERWSVNHITAGVGTPINQQLQRHLTLKVGSPRQRSRDPQTRRHKVGTGIADFRQVECSRYPGFPAR